MKFQQLTFLVLTGAALTNVAFGEPPTPVNPALRYYQAFLLAPDVTEADMDYLASNNLWSASLPMRFGQIVAKYDSEFKVLRQNLDAKTVCDWGFDFTEGPATLLPHLARCKAVMVGARYRVAWHLQQQRQTEARDDLVAAFTLARNISRDGTLISVLVQIAAESIGFDIIAENYSKFSPEVLRQLVEAIDTAPSRGGVAASIAFERATFHDWLTGRILQLQAAHPGDDSKVLSGIHELVSGMEGNEGGDLKANQPDTWERLSQAGGNTSEGILNCLKAESRLYDRVAELMALPYAEFDAEVKKFSNDFRPSQSPLLAEALPAFTKARHREFRAEVWLAMVHAALAYRLQGEPALLSVADPCGQGPFAFQRFILDGVDRGFQLKSVLQASGFQETMIFVEKPGAPFFLDGPHAGEPRALPNAQK